MTETTTEKHAREVLEAKGFKVERIPRGKTRTADLRVTDYKFSYLVEVTDRDEGNFLSDLRRAAVEKGVAERIRGFGIDSTLDGKITDKADASFLRLPRLDAGVLSTEEAGCMFVNSLSSSAASFRDSNFFGLVGEGARLDPSKAPAGVLFVDPTVDRRVRLASWQYLKEHYGVMTTEPSEVEWRGVISLPSEDPS